MAGSLGPGQEGALEHAGPNREEPVSHGHE